MDSQRLISHDAEIAVLKNDVNRMSMLFEKLETAIEKMGDVSNSIAQMLAVHESKISKSEHVEEELFTLVEKRKVEFQEDVKDLHSRITTVSRELSDEVVETEKRLMTILSNGINEIKLAITAEHAAVEKKADKLEKRLQTLERWRWLVIGGSGVAGAVLYELSKIFFR